MHAVRAIGMIQALESEKARPTCSWQMATVVTGDSMMFTPAATAETASPLRIPVWPRWAATREEEHAVSVLMHGPAG